MYLISLHWLRNQKSGENTGVIPESSPKHWLKIILYIHKPFFPFMTSFFVYSTDPSKTHALTLFQKMLSTARFLLLFTLFAFWFSHYGIITIKWWSHCQIIKNWIVNNETLIVQFNSSLFYLPLYKAALAHVLVDLQFLLELLYILLQFLPAKHEIFLLLLARTLLTLITQ